MGIWSRGQGVLSMIRSLVTSGGVVRFLDSDVVNDGGARWEGQIGYSCQDLVGGSRAVSLGKDQLGLFIPELFPDAGG